MTWREEEEEWYSDLCAAYEMNGYEIPPGHPDAYDAAIAEKDRLAEKGPVCACGCGSPAPIASRTDRTRGYVKGMPREYVHGHNRKGRGDPKNAIAPHGATPDRPPRWYVEGRDGKRYLWYRVLMENEIGRPLRPDEEVHHINGDPTDDRIENLLLLSGADHRRLHMAAGDMLPVQQRTHCPAGHEFTPDNVYIPSDGRRRCKACRVQRNREWRDRSGGSS